VIRQWLKGPEGDDYLILAGTSRYVARETESGSDVTGFLFFGGLPAYGLRRLFQTGGRLEVRWRDDVWAWSTHDEVSALAAADEVAELLASGAWVPQSMRQPTLLGAAVVR